MSDKIKCFPPSYKDELLPAINGLNNSRLHNDHMIDLLVQFIYQRRNGSLYIDIHTESILFLRELDSKVFRQEVINRIDDLRMSCFQNYNIKTQFVDFLLITYREELPLDLQTVAEFFIRSLKAEG